MFCSGCGKIINSNNRFCAYCGEKNILFSQKEQVQENINGFENDIFGNIKNKSNNIFDKLIEHTENVSTYIITPMQMCIAIYKIFIKDKDDYKKEDLKKRIRGISGYIGFNNSITSDDGRYVLYIGPVKHGFIFGIRRSVWIKDYKTSNVYEIKRNEHSMVKNGVLAMLKNNMSSDWLKEPLKKDLNWWAIGTVIFIGICICSYIYQQYKELVMERTQVHSLEVTKAEIAEIKAATDSSYNYNTDSKFVTTTTTNNLLKMASGQSASNSENTINIEDESKINGYEVYSVMNNTENLIECLGTETIRADYELIYNNTSNSMNSHFVSSEMCVDLGEDFALLQIGMDTPNGIFAGLYIDDEEYNLVNFLEMYNAFDSFGELNKGYYIQMSCLDLNNDSNKEIMVAIGDGMIESNMAVFNYNSYTKELEFCDKLNGQAGFMITEDNVIAVPYGSFGVVDTYVFENNKFVYTYNG